MGKKVRDKQRAKRKAERREAKIKEVEQVLFKCPACGAEENIPEEVVIQFDILDDGDTSVPPRFQCENCPADMEPVFYKSAHGIIYKIDK